MKILLIAGHGNGDPGACACGLKEADLTREVAAALLPKLKVYADVDLFDTSKNMYSYLKSGGICNFANYDYVFEVHFNAAAADTAGNGKTTGTEILIHTTESGASVEEAILNNIKVLGFKNRGVKRRSDLRNMNVCKKNYGVSYALIEVCFIDDRDDVNLYQQKKNEVIDAIVNGIASGFGLVKEESTMAGFKDTAGHYAEAHINDLLKIGVVNGDGNGNFRPNDNIKRGDVAIMVRNAIRYITGK